MCFHILKPLHDYFIINATKYVFFYIFRLRLDPLFWECILENAFLLKWILENTFCRMHFVENSAFGKILKLFIRSDYAERKCVWLVF
jgi:hypothetical protein